MDLIQFKEKFDTVLDKYLRNKIDQTKKTTNNKNIIDIVNHIHTICFAGGKRIRPYCFVMGYSIYQKELNDDIRNFAVLFEVLHTMALVHDDIIDEADKRHNVATIHHHIQNQKTTRRIAEGQAIMAGDLLLAWVYQLLTMPYNTDQSTIQAVQQTIHTMIQEVIIGEMIDIDLSRGETITWEDIENKNLYKTARYSFARPLMAGAQWAGADDQQVALLQQIGECLGLAYQIRDDILDITQSEQDKTTFGDVQEGQQTVLTQYIYTQTNEQHKQILQSCMGQKLNQEQINTLKNIFQESGAIDFGQQKIAAYIKDATALLTHITWHNDQTHKYIQQLMQRLTMI